MTGFTNYILEANVCLLIFLAAYKMLFGQETSFRSLRFLILSGILISLLAPLIKISYAATNPVGQVLPVYFPEIVISGSTQILFSDDATYNVWTIARGVYLSGVSVMLIVMMIRLIYLLNVISKAKAHPLGRYKVVESAKDVSPFSFFNFIYIGRVHELTVREKQQVIQHEIIHARQLHSLDILLLNIIAILFWFNPFIKSYKKIMVQLHEFEADECTVKNSDINDYCNLLAKVALQSTDFQLVNHFNQSLTLKRIEMIRTIKNKIKIWRLASMIVVFIVAFLITACQDQLSNNSATESGDKAFKIVEQVAVPEGGIEAFYRYIRHELRYPIEARKKQAQGKVLVEFIVKKDGTLSDIKILESPDPSLANEVTRVLTGGPKWTPAKLSGELVNQQMILPLTFKLEGIQPIAVATKNPETSLSEIVVVGFLPRIK